MSTRNDLGTISKLPELSDESLQENWGELMPLIQAEWPNIDTDVIKAAEGDLAAIVDYIAAQTEHTRTLVRRQLAELNSLAIRDRIAAEAPIKSVTNGNRIDNRIDTHTNASTDTETNNKTSNGNSSGLSSEIDQVLQVLERHTDDLLQQFKKDVLPEVSDRARSNIGTSLLTALGIGFLLGIIIGGGRGR